MSAPNSISAYKAMQKLRYKGSYDSLKNWRNANQQARADGIPAAADHLATMIGRLPTEENDPVKAAMILAGELNDLCMRLTSLLSKHQWVEAGEDRLSNRDALKILSSLPSLHRAASGTVLEMHKTKIQVDQHDLLLGFIRPLAKLREISSF